MDYLFVSRINRFFVEISIRLCKEGKRKTVFIIVRTNFIRRPKAFPLPERYLVLWKMRCPLSGGAFFLFRPPFKAV